MSSEWHDVGEYGSERDVEWKKMQERYSYNAGRRRALEWYYTTAATSGYLNDSRSNLIRPRKMISAIEAASKRLLSPRFMTAVPMVL